VSKQIYVSGRWVDPPKKPRAPGKPAKCECVYAELHAHSQNYAAGTISYRKYVKLKCGAAFFWQRGCPPAIGEMANCPNCPRVVAAPVTP